MRLESPKAVRLLKTDLASTMLRFEHHFGGESQNSTDKYQGLSYILRPKKSLVSPITANSAGINSTKFITHIQRYMKIRGKKWKWKK